MCDATTALRREFQNGIGTHSIGHTTAKNPQHRRKSCNCHPTGEMCRILVAIVKNLCLEKALACCRSKCAMCMYKPHCQPHCRIATFLAGRFTVTRYDMKLVISVHAETADGVVG